MTLGQFSTNSKTSSIKEILATNEWIVVEIQNILNLKLRHELRETSGDDRRPAFVATIDFSVRPQLCWQRLVLKPNEMHPKEYYGQTSLHYR